MVRLTITFPAGTARRAQGLLDALRYLMASARFEPGCQTCSAWAEQDATVHYVEQWDTEAELRRRVTSPAFTSLLNLMESAEEAPRVQFDFVTRTRGLDYVAEVRHDRPH
jgi:quinol monooxygenase YgiN